MSSEAPTATFPPLRLTDEKKSFGLDTSGLMLLSKWSELQKPEDTTPNFIYRLLIGPEQCTTLVSKDILMQSKNLAGYINKLNPSASGGDLVLLGEKPFEVTIVLKHLNNGKLQAPLIDSNGEKDISEWDPELTDDVTLYLIGMHHGVDSLCQRAIANVQNLIESPKDLALLVSWEDIKRLTDAGFGDSPMAGIMIQGKVLMMRLFGDEDMPRYKEYLLNEPVLMLKCLTTLASADPKQRPPVAVKDIVLCG